LRKEEVRRRWAFRDRRGSIPWRSGTGRTRSLSSLEREL